MEPSIQKITREEYLVILSSTKEKLQQQLEAIEAAEDDAKGKVFDLVEVLQEDGKHSFRPVVKDDNQ